MKQINVYVALVEAIHESDIYGCFVEMGCGVALTNALMSVPGATKTVYMAETPYAREYQHEKYNNQGVRAVSKESVEKILESLRAAQQGYNGVNSIYVASFQLASGPGTSTHGWIGYRYKEVTKYYHISIHEEMSRREYMQEIASCGLEIVLSQNNYVPTDAHIDICDGYDDIAMYEMLGNSIDENFLCIRNGEFHRMEDLFRDEKNILIFKGSFNPIHVGHIEIIDEMSKTYGSLPKLMISMEIFGKDPLTPVELRSRVSDLNKLGYDVIISKFGFFDENIEYIRKKFKQPIVFGMGMDTLIRIFKSSYPILDQNDNIKKESLYFPYKTAFMDHFSDTKLFVVNRDGYKVHELFTDAHYEVCDRIELHNIKHSDVSSTDIRNGGNIESVPEPIRDKYKK